MKVILILILILILLIKITRTADLTGTSEPPQLLHSLTCFSLCRSFPGWRLLVSGSGTAISDGASPRRFNTTAIMCGSQLSVLTCRVPVVDGTSPIMWVSERGLDTRSRYPQFSLPRVQRVAGWQLQHFSSLISRRKATMIEKSLSIIIAIIERAVQSDYWFVQSPLCCRVYLVKYLSACGSGVQTFVSLPS
jgi:hypothetical protein